MKFPVKLHRPLGAGLFEEATQTVVEPTSHSDGSGTKERLATILGRRVDIIRFVEWVFVTAVGHLLLVMPPISQPLILGGLVFGTVIGALQGLVLRWRPFWVGMWMLATVMGFVVFSYGNQHILLPFNALDWRHWVGVGFVWGATIGIMQAVVGLMLRWRVSSALRWVFANIVGYTTGVVAGFLGFWMWGFLVAYALGGAVVGIVTGAALVWLHLALMTRIDVVSISRLVASLIGGYFAVGFAYSPQGFSPDGIWVPGLVFGVVVLVWQSRTVRELFHPRSADFLLASTLIFILVVRLIEKNIKIDPFEIHHRVGISDWIVFLSVALGTILLGLAHALLLRAAWQRVLVAIPSTLGVWYLGWHWSSSINIPIWQAAYMLLMFAPTPKSLVAHRRRKPPNG